MFNKIKEKISTSWIFCALSLTILTLIFIFDPVSTRPIISILWNLTKNIVPVLILVFIIIFMFNIFLNPKKISHLLGENSKFKGWFLAIILGILSSGPIYAWYPLVADLQKQGMRKSLSIAFLYNRAIKIPLMPMVVVFFGWPFLIITSILMVVFSIINGFLGEKMLIKLGGAK